MDDDDDDLFAFLARVKKQGAPSTAPATAPSKAPATTPAKATLAKAPAPAPALAPVPAIQAPIAAAPLVSQPNGQPQQGQVLETFFLVVTSQKQSFRKNSSKQ